MDSWADESVIMGVMGTAASDNVRAIDAHVGPTMFIDQNSPEILKERVYSRYIVIDSIAYHSQYMGFTCNGNAFACEVNLYPNDPLDPTEPNTPLAVDRLHSVLHNPNARPRLYFDTRKDLFYITIGYLQQSQSTIYFQPYTPPPASPSSRKPSRRDTALSNIFSATHRLTTLHPSILATVHRCLELGIV